jgi:4-amino-4-deoxy-L-arabinose transferase-like glycosyltransferase
VRRPVVVLLFLSLLTFFLGLGRPAITDSDEAFYAEAAREMVERGDWLTPHYNYQFRWQKPVLYYWLAAATYLIGGVSEWAARCWSAASGLGLVMLTYAAGRHLTTRQDVALLAGAITATSFGYFVMARLALPDLPLTFFITLTIWMLLQASGGDGTARRRWVVAGAAAGLGFLMKGPVALAVPAVAAAPIWLVERRFPRLRQLLVAAAVFLVVGSPWYVAMTMAHGTAYLHSFFVGDNLERFATDRFNDPRPIWFYAPIVLGGMMPWTPFLLLWIAPLRDIVTRRRKMAEREWRLVLWSAMPLIFYTASVGKQPRYILPVLPPLAILLARSILDGRRGPVRVAATMSAVILATVAVLLYRARALFVTALPPLTWTAIAALSVSALALIVVAWSVRWRQVPAVMTAAAAVTLLAAQFGALSGVRPEPVEQMAAMVRQHRAAGEAVGEYQVFVRNLVFYARFPQHDLHDEPRALAFMKSPSRVLMVVRSVDLPRLEANAGIAMRRLGEVMYLNTADLKFRTLLRPDADDEPQIVLLVTNLP